MELADNNRQPEPIQNKEANDLIDLVKGVETVNADFSVGSKIGHFLALQIHQQIQPDYVPPQAPTYSERQDEIFKTKLSVLNQAGLELTSNLEEHLDFVFKHLADPAPELEQTRHLSADEVSITLNDAYQLQNYLEKIPTECFQNKELQTALTALAKDLSNQFMVAYMKGWFLEHEAVMNDSSLQQAIDNSNSSIDELYMDLYMIADTLEERGLRSQAYIIKNYLEHHQSGDLKEYLMAEKTGLLSLNTGNFDPSNWHTDISPEAYQDQWDELLNRLEYISANDNAKHLAIHVYNKVLDCLATAEKDFENHNNFFQKYNLGNKHIPTEVIDFYNKNLEECNSIIKDSALPRLRDIAIHLEVDGPSWFEEA